MDTAVVQQLIFSSSVQKWRHFASTELGIGGRRKVLGLLLLFVSLYDLVLGQNSDESARKKKKGKKKGGKKGKQSRYKKI